MVLTVTTAAPQSGLIVAVPEAEPVVAPHRHRLDASAPLGVPAHITVLFPFLPPELIDETVLEDLGQLFAGVRPFRFRLDHTDWFGDDVLWLGPHDPGPFRALTERVYAAFPACPPFEGQFDDVVPHLTVGHGRAVNDLRAAEKSVQTHLPIDGYAIAVTLMTQQSTGGHWSVGATFSLS
jgi:2'-5' RNA ligase